MKLSVRKFIQLSSNNKKVEFFNYIKISNVINLYVISRFLTTSFFEILANPKYKYVFCHIRPYLGINFQCSARIVSCRFDSWIVSNIVSLVVE